MEYIEKAIENLHNLCVECPNYMADTCIKKNCNIGFSLGMMEYMKESNKMLVEEEEQIIPYQDMKNYDEKKVASTIASICRLCKECNANHKESCAVSLARKSLEDTVLKDMEVYPGNFLSYIMNVGKKDAYISNLIMEEYQKLS